MWIVFGLLTAILRSIQDLLSKKISSKVDPLLLAWGWGFFSLPYLFVIATIEGWPKEVDIVFFKAF